MRKISYLLIAILFGGVALLWLSKNNTKEVVVNSTPLYFNHNTNDSTSAEQIAQFANFTKPAQNRNYARKAAAQGGLDFTQAAGIATPAVVHIKTKVTKQPVGNNQQYQQSPLYELFGDDFFNDWFDQGQQRQGYGGRGQQRRGGGSGSGVIISSDGYIVSNNHVVSAGDEIEVVLDNNQSYYAQVIGTDPSTDIALIKIEEKGLPFLNFANSDQVKVGEWVLAVGNPFNLASTVTAGIVSAKARNINILKDKAAIESFIQTDAAVNPGNSGGALVNLNGELIGINTAIATPTGTFAGYSFAVPANLVKKVVTDLRSHGVVQRAYIGVNIADLNADLSKELGLDMVQGVYVDGTLAGSGAEEAGLQKGDVIVEVNNKAVITAPELQEAVANFRPGDQVDVSFIRNNKKRNTRVTLKNSNMTTKQIQKGIASSEVFVNSLGAELSTISDSEKRKFGISNGIKVNRLLNGKLSNSTDIREGFIITKIDQQEVSTISDIENILSRKKGGVMIEGVYPGGDGVYYYAFGM